MVRICFFWFAIWIYLKSLNGSPARDILGGNAARQRHWW